MPRVLNTMRTELYSKIVIILSLLYRLVVTNV